ncbi:MAG: OmpA family protein [Roseomonas sp.]|jgi:hypothetical protein|nr:OmpA family protein [Roseomonas sp.]
MRRCLLAGLAILPFIAGCTLLPSDLPEEPVRVVFFTEDSAAIDEVAAGIVVNAAQLAAENPSAPVRVLGFAGPDGGRAYNRALSDARALAVAEQLRLQGVSPTRISVSPRGAVPFEMMPLESRRVEIRVGGASAPR